MVFKPGSTIGPHMIIKEIGSSWSGDTFLAEQTGTTSQRCILKILPPEFAAQPDASERFQKIMEPVSRLEHQNIVRMDGFGLSDGHFWLRSEVIEGVESGIPGRNLLSLADYSKLCNNKIPEEELLEILKQATAGLYYAHQNNIIHCDLKPANILFDAPDEESQVPSVKISGFGLVQLLGVEGLLGEVHFSPSDPRPSSDTYKFMSPELKLQKNVDVRSDIYSMGLMTLNLLTSYDGVGIKLPSRIIPSLSSAWDIFVLESVRYDQSNRVQDYETFYNQLKAVWDSLPVSKLAVESAPARKNPAKAPDRPKPEPVQKPLKEIRKEEIIPSATNDAGNTDTLPSKLVSTETLKDKPSQHAKPLKEAVAVQDEVVRRKMTEFTSPIKEKIPVQAEAIKDKVTEPAKPIKELTPAQQPVVVHDQATKSVSPSKEKTPVQDEVVRRKMTELTISIKEKIPVQAEAIKKKVTELTKPLKEKIPVQAEVVRNKITKLTQPIREQIPDKTGFMKTKMAGTNKFVINHLPVISLSVFIALVVVIMSARCISNRIQLKNVIISNAKNIPAYTRSISTETTALWKPLIEEDPVFAWHVYKKYLGEIGMTPDISSLWNAVAPNTPSRQECIRTLNVIIARLDPTTEPTLLREHLVFLRDFLIAMGRHIDEQKTDFNSPNGWTPIIVSIPMIENDFSKKRSELVFSDDIRVAWGLQHLPKMYDLLKKQHEKERAEAVAKEEYLQPLDETPVEIAKESMTEPAPVTPEPIATDDDIPDEMMEGLEDVMNGLDKTSEKSPDMPAEIIVEPAPETQTEEPAVDNAEKPVQLQDKDSEKLMDGLNNIMDTLEKTTPDMPAEIIVEPAPEMQTEEPAVDNAEKPVQPMADIPTTDVGVLMVDEPVVSREEPENDKSAVTNQPLLPLDDIPSKDVDVLMPEAPAPVEQIGDTIETTMPEVVPQAFELTTTEKQPEKNDNVIEDTMPEVTTQVVELTMPDKQPEENPGQQQLSVPVESFPTEHDVKINLFKAAKAKWDEEYPSEDDLIDIFLYSPDLLNSATETARQAQELQESDPGQGAVKYHEALKILAATKKHTSEEAKKTQTEKLKLKIQDINIKLDSKTEGVLIKTYSPNLWRELKAVLKTANDEKADYLTRLEAFYRVEGLFDHALKAAMVAEQRHKNP